MKFFSKDLKRWNLRIEKGTSMEMVKEFDFGFRVYEQKGFYHIKGSHHRVKIPRLDKKFALFLGLLWGDGCITNMQYAKKMGDWRVVIVEDDQVLKQEIINLISQIFGIKARIHYRKTHYEIYFCSRIVYEILSKKFGFPDGLKRDRLNIPLQILADRNLIKSFLCGLFSTDGAITFSQNYPRISVSSASYEFINEVHASLKELGFNAHLNRYDRKIGNPLYSVRLNGLSQSLLFYKYINFIGEKQYRLKNLVKHNIMEAAPSSSWPRKAGFGPANIGSNPIGATVD